MEEEGGWGGGGGRLHCSSCMRPLMGCKKRPGWSGERGCMEVGWRLVVTLQWLYEAPCGVQEKTWVVWGKVTCGRGCGG